MQMDQHSKQGIRPGGESDALAKTYEGLPRDWGSWAEQDMTDWYVSAAGE